MLTCRDFFGNDEQSFTSESNENSKSNLQLSKKDFGSNIYAKTFINNNNFMRTSFSKNNEIIDDNYFDKNEQINEVKVNMFLILTKDFRLDLENYSEFLEDQYLKAKRLIYQEIHYDGGKLNFGEKNYKFLPIKSLDKSSDIIFRFDNNEIIYKGEKEKHEELFYNKECLLAEEQFLKENKNFYVDKKTKELLIKNCSSNIIKNEQATSDSNKSSSKDGLSQYSLDTKTDKSENEIKGKRFYKVLNENRFIRFVYNKYIKEIDGIYNSHKVIKLNCPKMLDLEEKLKNLEKEYNINNDLNCCIIFKNFESTIIEEDEPLILEVKSSFKLIEILNQIRQSAKFFNNLIFTKNKLPKTAIGILCSDKVYRYEDQLKELFGKYKGNANISYFQHMINTINNNGFQVILGVIKDSKIQDYPLDTIDYAIPGENLVKRVDIHYMNEKIKAKKTDEELTEIENAFKYKYKSLTYTKKIDPLDYQKLQKELFDTKAKISSVNAELSKKDKELSIKNKIIDELQEELAKYKSEKK